MPSNKVTTLTQVLPPIPSELAAQGIGLREQQSEDMAFVRHLFLQARWRDLEPTGWANEQKEIFLNQQFTFQDTHYTRMYPGMVRSIVTSEGGSVGRLYLYRMERVVRLVDIALLPEHRSRGLGTGLISALVKQAHAHGETVALQVDANNPARRLYERLGFTEVSGDEVYCQMLCPPRTESRGREHWDALQSQESATRQDLDGSNPAH